MPPLKKLIKPLKDISVTLVLWVYFTIGFLLFFFPFYIAAFFISGSREASFQKMNHIFYRSFLSLAGLMIQGLKIKIDREAMAIRSSVIVCNHLSYLDPILIISFFEKHKTIVKNSFFYVPVFGWFLRVSGYIPSEASGRFSSRVIRQVEGMKDFLTSGGNLFIFPEGTRSRDGKIGKFAKGAFSIARQCGAPMRVLSIKHSNELFRPGKLLFNTDIDHSIEVKLVGNIEPDYKNDKFTLSGLMEEVRVLLEENMD